MNKILILILFCNFSSLYSQKENAVDNWNKREVVEKDSLDINLNRLIEKNEILDFRERSFGKKNIKWRPGLIYTLNNDTLRGEVKNIRYKEGVATIYVSFRKDKQSPRKKYRADKVLGYSSNDREYFSRKFSDFPPCFIERLEMGELNLYYVKFNEVKLMHPTNSVLALRKGKTEFFIERSDSLQEKLSGPIPYKPKNFKVFISSFIHDYPELQVKVQKGIYNKEHIREIIQLYNYKTGGF